MTNDDLILLSKFAFGLRKITGTRVEVDRFVSDRFYAKEMLDVAEDHAEAAEDLDMMLMILKLRQKVGLMAAEMTALPPTLPPFLPPSLPPQQQHGGASAPPAATGPADGADPAEPRYVGRLR